MASEREVQEFLDRLGALRETLTARLAPQLLDNPQLAEVLTKQLDEMFESVVLQDRAATPPPDLGLAELAGLGEGAAREFGQTRLPPGVEPYDETVMSERIVAVGDLYYIYQHEKIGVFRAIQKLQELFRSGSVRLSSGPGAFALYQFDRREVLRYTVRDRLAAYRRVLGYGSQATTMPGSRPNTDFHPMFSHFINQITLYWRDKRVSDVIRERAHDPSFGSVAIVRRAGLDLRNNLKFTSFGHLNVMRVEVMQLLDEAFRILGAEDVKRLFGADSAWDVVEEILLRYFNERLVTSPRQRMAVAGREVLRWLAQPHINQNQRVQFEAMLMDVAEYAEEWLTSAQALGLARRNVEDRVMNAETRDFPAERPKLARPVARPARPRELNGVSREW